MTIDSQKGIHWPTMITATMCLVSVALYLQLLMPNLPFLIRSYYPDIESENIGFYAGYLVSFFFLGQIPGCFFWGWSADNYGRRKSGIWVALGNAIFIFALGLSKNYKLSLLIRFLHGILDGSYGVCKTIIADLCNDSNIAVGTGMIFVGGAIGGFLGPIIGGYLSNPEIVKPVIDFLPFLRDIPYMIPLTVSSLFFVITFFMFIFLAEETLSPEEIANARRIKGDMNDNLSSLLLRSISCSFTSHEQLILLYDKHSGYAAIFKNKNLILSITWLGTIAFIQMTFDTIYPLTLMNKHHFGGFEMDAIEESWIATFGGVIQIFTLLICPLWSRICSYKVQLTWMTIVMTLFMFLVPLISRFNSSEPLVQFIITLCTYATQVIVRVIQLNTCIVLVSNSSYKEFRGTAVGFGQVIAGTCRFIGPFFIPTLFSWSTNVDKFPINYGFSYYVLGIISLLSLILPIFITKETDFCKGTIYDSIEHKEPQPYCYSPSDVEAIHI